MSIKNRRFMLLGFAVTSACMSISTMAAEDNWQNNSFFKQMEEEMAKSEERMNKIYSESQERRNKIYSELMGSFQGTHAPSNQYYGNPAPYWSSDWKSFQAQQLKVEQERLERNRIQQEQEDTLWKERHARLDKECQDVLNRSNARVMQIEKERQEREAQERKAEQERVEQSRRQQAVKERLAREAQERKAEQERLEQSRRQQAVKGGQVRQTRQIRAEQERLAQSRLQQAEKERQERLAQQAKAPYAPPAQSYAPWQQPQQQNAQKAAPRFQPNQIVNEEIACLSASLAAQRSKVMEAERIRRAQEREDQIARDEYAQLIAGLSIKQEEKKFEQKVLTSEEKNEKAFGLALDLISNAQGQDEIKLTELLSAMIEAELGLDKTESAPLAKATILSLRDDIQAQQEYDLQESKASKKVEEVEEKSFSVSDGMIVEILDVGKEFFQEKGRFMNESEVKNLLLEKYPVFKNLTPEMFEKGLDEVCMQMGI